MPHDKNKRPLSVGALVTISAIVTAIHSQGEAACNITAEVQGLDSEYRPAVSMNSKLVELVQSAPGEKREETTFIDVEAYGKQAEAAENAAKKAAAAPDKEKLEATLHALRDFSFPKISNSDAKAIADATIKSLMRVANELADAIDAL